MWIFEHGAWFTARGAGLQAEAAGFTGRCFYVDFRARGKVYSPRCWVYRLRRRGLQVIAFYVVFSGTGQGLQPEVRVYSPRCGVYRSRRRGLQFVAFYVVFSSTGQGLQPEVRGVQVEAVGFTGHPLLRCMGFRGTAARFTAARCGFTAARCGFTNTAPGLQA